MMLSMTTATMADGVSQEIRIIELANTIANDTIQITPNIKKYELNLNKNFIKISEILELNQDQSDVLYNLQDSLKRDFERLNNVKSQKQREKMFMNSINRVFYTINIKFDKKQSRMYKALMNITLNNKGYIKYGEFCDLFAPQPDVDVETAAISTDELI